MAGNVQEGCAVRTPPQVLRWAAPSCLVEGRMQLAREPCNEHVDVLLQSAALLNAHSAEGLVQQQVGGALEEMLGVCVAMQEGLNMFGVVHREGMANVVRTDRLLACNNWCVCPRADCP